MIETAHETATDEADETPPRTSFDELVAEPERVARATDAGPVRIARPGGDDLVLLRAADFERLRGARVEVLLASELDVAEAERMLAQPLPLELAALDDEIPDGWLDEHERLIEARR